MAVQKQDDRHEHTIGKTGERGSGISVLPARHDDDDDDLVWHTSLWLVKETAVSKGHPSQQWRQPWLLNFNGLAGTSAGFGHMPMNYFAILGGFGVFFPQFYFLFFYIALSLSIYLSLSLSLSLSFYLILSLSLSYTHASSLSQPHMGKHTHTHTLSLSLSLSLSLCTSFSRFIMQAVHSVSLKKNKKRENHVRTSFLPQVT